jgi:hypothetical protein
MAKVTYVREGSPLSDMDELSHVIINKSKVLLSQA